MRTGIVNQQEYLAVLLLEAAVELKDVLLENITPHPCLLVAKIVDVWETLHIDIFIAPRLGSFSYDKRLVLLTA
jgi:hypothetical protein